MANIKQKIIKMFILGFKEMQDPYYQGFAAQVAFYLMLSITPIIILVTQILGIFHISIDKALEFIEEYTGGQVSSLITKLFEFSSVGYANIIFLVIALWAGSRASFSIMRITNYTMSDGTSTGRNYFIERLRAIRTMFLTIIAIVFAIVILMYGDLILQAVLTALKIDSSKVDDNIWLSLRWVMGGLLYFLMVSYNYWIMPTVRVTFKSIIPGSVFAAAGMLIVTRAYATYASSLANYDVLYGALSSVIALLIWFFLMAWVMFLGVLCNKVWWDSNDYHSSDSYPDYLKHD